MPAKPETKLYQRLKENLQNCLITRIESRVNLGIPDCLIALRRTGTFVPVELKVVKHGRRVRLSPHQIAFHSRHAELGCATFVLVLFVPFACSKMPVKGWPPVEPSCVKNALFSALAMASA